MSDTQKDRIFGLLAGLFALVYLWYANGIEDSMLADSVGANGVPLLIGSIVLASSVALVIKSFIAAKPVAAADEEAADPAAEWRSIRIAASLMAILLVYVIVLPLAGYIISVSVLVLAVAMLAKAPLKPTLFITAALSGVTFWILFELMLTIHMPKGLLFS